MKNTKMKIMQIARENRKVAYQRLDNNIPSIFNNFNSKRLSAETLGIRDYGPDYRYWQLSCACGEENLHLEVHAVPRGKLAAIFFGDDYEGDGPIRIKCPVCQRVQILCDRSQHGFDGMFGEAKLNGVYGKLKTVNSNPAPIFINLVYEWVSSLDRFTGGENIEDYFDAIGVGFSAYMNYGWESFFGETHNNFREN